MDVTGQQGSENNVNRDADLSLVVLVFLLLRSASKSTSRGARNLSVPYASLYAFPSNLEKHGFTEISTIS